MHALYREVLYRRAPPSRRARLHLTIAQQLEAKFRTHLREAAPILAHHFERGGDWAAAVRYLKMVAEAAGRRHAPLMAEQALQHALKLIARLPEPERVLEIEILETLATIYVICFDPRAISTHEALIKSAQHFRLIDAEVRALLSMALPAAWVSPPSYFTGVLDRALELAHYQDPTTCENTRLTALLWRLGAEWNFERADECRRKYDEIRTRNNDSVQAGHLLSFAFFLTNRSEYREALRCAREGVQLLVKEFAENSQLSIHYTNYLVIVPRALTLLGHWGNSLKEVAATVNAVESDGNTELAKGFRLFATPVHLHAFDFAGAWEFCEPFFTTVTTESTWSFVRRAYMIRAACAQTGLGNHDMALAIARQVQEEMLEHPMLDDWLSRIPMEAALTELWLAKGDLVRAQSQARNFLDLCLCTSERTWQALAWEANARIAEAASDIPRAVECITEARKSIEGFEVPLAAWRVYGTAARLCEQQVDQVGAIAHRSSSARIIRSLAASLSEYPRIQHAFLEAAPVRAVLGREPLREF